MGSLNRNTMRGSILFLAAALPSGIGLARQEQEICGTHALRTAEEMALHAASSKSLAKAGRLRAASLGAGRDEGNIFVLEDDGDVISRRNVFNLEGREIVFFPAESGYRYEVRNAEFDDNAASRGGPLTGLDDDDSKPVTLPFEFPFFGQRYTSLFLNSDGNLTFEEKDDSSSDRSAGRATAGLPRISGLYRDLDPSRVPDGVRVLLESGRAVFTWNDIPEYRDLGTGPRNTFQIRIYADGRIELSYSQVRTRTAVVGLGRGRIGSGDAFVAFSEGTSARTFPGAIVERFSDVQEVDTVLAARRFYEAHSDSFDFIAFYNDLGIPAGDGALAWESTVRNRTSGIGDAIRDAGAFYGSNTRLQGILNMGPLSQYPDDPFTPVPGRMGAGDNSLSVLAHEFGHRWLAFVSVRDQTANGNTPMLGRQSAHWSFAFNSEASLLEGNRIADNGPDARPRFLTTAVTQAYSPLDQYLMGLRAPGEVAPVFYVANPSTPIGNRAPLVGVSFDGNRRDVTIEELIGIHGSRDPDHEISQRQFRLAIVLITRPGQPFAERSIAKVERFRQNFEPYIDRVTDGRASIDTSLRPAIELSAWPAMAMAEGTESEVWVTIPAPRAETLELTVTASEGLDTPAGVTIAAGETGALIRVRSTSVGVYSLSVADTTARFAPSTTRVRVVRSAGR